jgi:hypothetical protein
MHSIRSCSYLTFATSSDLRLHGSSCSLRIRSRLNLDSCYRRCSLCYLHCKILIHIYPQVQVTIAPTRQTQKPSSFYPNGTSVKSSNCQSWAQTCPHAALCWACGCLSGRGTGMKCRISRSQRSTSHLWTLSSFRSSGYRSILWLPVLNLDWTSKWTKL